MQDVVFHQNGEHLTNLWPCTQWIRKICVALFILLVPMEGGRGCRRGCGCRRCGWDLSSRRWGETDIVCFSTCTYSTVSAGSVTGRTQDHMLGCSPCGLEERGRVALALIRGLARLLSLLILACFDYCHGSWASEAITCPSICVRLSRWCP